MAGKRSAALPLFGDEFDGGAVELLFESEGDAAGHQLSARKRVAVPRQAGGGAGLQVDLFQKVSAVRIEPGNDEGLAGAVSVVCQLPSERYGLAFILCNII